MLKKGNRIELLEMNDPDPIPKFTKGTVISAGLHVGSAGKWAQVDVDWDNGRTLMLTIPPDSIRRIR